MPPSNRAVSLYPDLHGYRSLRPQGGLASATPERHENCGDCHAMPEHGQRFSLLIARFELPRLDELRYNEWRPVLAREHRIGLGITDTGQCVRIKMERPAKKVGNVTQVNEHRRDGTLLDFRSLVLPLTAPNRVHKIPEGALPPSQRGLWPGRLFFAQECAKA